MCVCATDGLAQAMAADSRPDPLILKDKPNIHGTGLDCLEKGKYRGLGLECLDFNPY